MFYFDQVFFFCELKLLFFQAMDERGILACSETNYIAYIPTTNSDRKSTGSLQNIFTLHDSNIPACFTNITPVSVYSFLNRRTSKTHLLTDQIMTLLGCRYCSQQG
jgi:hypothetical protein